VAVLGLGDTNDRLASPACRPHQHWRRRCLGGPRCARLTAGTPTRWW
jgi:hypothetical protein